MITKVDVAEFGPKWEALVDSLAENGREIFLTLHGKRVAKLIRVDNASEAAAVAQPQSDGLVLYNGPLDDPSRGGT